ncbi:MAG: hypothetical protein IK141_04655 [Clostridia bacterium]|nr:hypothetical protein [Clostridia bacterium]
MPVVPIRKQSKKAQKKENARQRRNWNGLNPVSRTVPSGKVYNRKRLKREDRIRREEG